MSNETATIDRARTYGLEEITPDVVAWLKENAGHAITVRTTRGKLKRVACVRDLEWTRNDDGTYGRRVTHRWSSKSATDWRASWGGITNELLAVLEPERHAAMQERRRKESEERRRREREAAASVAVGDVFVTSWGYEQTNVDYFEVVEKRGQYVTVRPIASRTVEDTGWMQRTVEAVPGRYLNKCALIDDEPSARYKVKGTKNSPRIDLTSFASAYIWDGKPDCESSYY